MIQTHRTDLILVTCSDSSVSDMIVRFLRLQGFTIQNDCNRPQPQGVNYYLPATTPLLNQKAQNTNKGESFTPGATSQLPTFTWRNADDRLLLVNCNEAAEKLTNKQPYSIFDYVPNLEASIERCLARQQNVVTEQESGNDNWGVCVYVEDGSVITYVMATETGAEILA